MTVLDLVALGEDNDADFEELIDTFLEEVQDTDQQFKLLEAIRKFALDRHCNSYHEILLEKTREPRADRRGSSQVSTKALIIGGVALAALAIGVWYFTNSTPVATVMPISAHSINEAISNWHSRIGDQQLLGLLKARNWEQALPIANDLSSPNHLQRLETVILSVLHHNDPKDIPAIKVARDALKALPASLGRRVLNERLGDLGVRVLNALPSLDAVWDLCKHWWSTEEDHEVFANLVLPQCKSREVSFLVDADVKRCLQNLGTGDTSGCQKTMNFLHDWWGWKQWNIPQRYEDKIRDGIVNWVEQIKEPTALQPLINSLQRSNGTWTAVIDFVQSRQKSLLAPMGRIAS